MKATDRCDRCGAQAHVSAMIPTGVLLFCVHHYRENRDALNLAGAIVVDETPATFDSPAASCHPTP